MPWLDGVRSQARVLETSHRAVVLLIIAAVAARNGDCVLRARSSCFAVGVTTGCCQVPWLDGGRSQARVLGTSHRTVARPVVTAVAAKDGDCVLRARSSCFAVGVAACRRCLMSSKLNYKRVALSLR